MIKAKFIGTSDDFFICGDVYVIRKSWTDRALWTRFSKYSHYCPCCGHTHTVVSDREERSTCYSTLTEFLENWEIIYDD